LISCEGIYEIKKNGMVVAQGKNLLTDNFLLALLEALLKASGAGGVAQEWDAAAGTIQFALGTDNDPPPKVTDTALNAQHTAFNPTTTTYQRTADDPKQLFIQYTGSYTAGGNVTLLEMGMIYTRAATSSPATHLISRWIVDSIVMEAGDVLAVTWALYFRRDFSA
jgi:hypothetical protein